MKIMTAILLLALCSTHLMEAVPATKASISQQHTQNKKNRTIPIFCVVTGGISIAAFGNRFKSKESNASKPGEQRTNEAVNPESAAAGRSADIFADEGVPSHDPKAFPVVILVRNITSKHKLIAWSKHGKSFNADLPIVHIICNAFTFNIQGLESNHIPCLTATLLDIAEIDSCDFYPTNRLPFLMIDDEHYISCMIIDELPFFLYPFNKYEIKNTMKAEKIQQIINQWIIDTASFLDILNEKIKHHTYDTAGDHYKLQLLFNAYCDIWNHTKRRLEIK